MVLLLEVAYDGRADELWKMVVPMAMGLIVLSSFFLAVESA